MDMCLSSIKFALLFLSMCVKAVREPESLTRMVCLYKIMQYNYHVVFKYTITEDNNVVFSVGRKFVGWIFA